MTGFAGSTADAFTLVERLEAKLEEYPGQLLRAAVETAKCWRTDKYTRHLEALLIAADENISICLSGNGDVIESHDGLIGIGSGGTYALAAARALIDLPEVDAMTVAKKSMTIASDICVYTNSNFVIDSMDLAEPAPEVPPRV
jgi:ATP-dependent HslUV protease subunit HslV